MHVASFGTSSSVRASPFASVSPAVNRGGMEASPYGSITLMLLLVVPCLAEEQQPIQDLNLLVGKQVVVQRMPLCQPGTYTTVLAYAGKYAKVVSMKPFNMPHVSESTMNRLPPDAPGSN